MNHFQFSTVFLSRRKELGVTQEQIATYIGVSRAAVSKWEKGQSYPDITLLPKLATYFNISIDTLLGYEPQLTKERIIEIYTDLSKQFSEKPYEEVIEQIELLVTEYYACFSLVLKMAQLYLNYLSKAPDPVQQAERIVQLCQRVRDRSDDYSLTNEAMMIELHALLIQGKAIEVIEQLGSNVKVQFGGDQLVATAHLMLGHTEKAKEIMQASLYQNIVLAIATATESLLMEVANPVHFQTTVQRTERLIELFQINPMNINVGLVFYIKVATGYAMQNHIEEALAYLEKYVRLCCEITFPIILRGDDYFYLLEDWLRSEMQLASVTPRDEQSIKQDLVGALTQNPVFATLAERQEFKTLISNLEHIIT